MTRALLLGVLAASWSMSAQAQTPTQTQTQTSDASPRTAPTASSQPSSSPQAPPPGPREEVLDGEVAGPSEPEPDDGKSNWGVFYIEASFGYSFANLVQFSQENFIPEATRLDGSGYMGGLAAGFRIYWVTVGARATLARYSTFDLGTVGADLAVHLPVPVLRPYVRVGLGYGWLGDADFSEPALSETRVYGLVVDAGLGLNIKLNRFISLGAGFDAAFLNLTRQGLEDATGVTGVNIEEDGDSVGLQLRLHAHLTFHI